MKEYMVAVEAGEMKQVFYVQCNSAQKAEDLVRNVVGITEGAKIVVGEVTGKSGLALEDERPVRWLP